VKGWRSAIARAQNGHRDRIGTNQVDGGRLRSSHSGVALVEFAVVGPLFLFVVFGVLQIASLFVQRALVFDSFSSLTREILQSPDVCEDVYRLSPDNTYGIEQFYDFVPYQPLLASSLVEFQSIPYLAPRFDGISLPLRATPCQAPIGIQLRFELDYDLACPMCRILSLGLSSSTYRSQLTVLGGPESLASRYNCFYGLLPQC
jgi:hypothetical protein